MKSCWYPAIIAAAIGLGSGAALAQPWPSKPIRAFIPFAAGSATDIVPRALFEPLGAELGQSIIVENRGGAGGTLGMGAVVRADPDGYTILANSSAHTVAPWIVPNFPFDLTKDLSGALMIGQLCTVISSSLKSYNSVRGSHVHVARFSDEEIDRLATLELLSLGANDDFGKLMKNIFLGSYRTTRKKWADKIIKDSIEINKLLDIYFEVLTKVLFKDGNLIIPDNYK